jgi:lysophospholipase L1-like esterase
MRYLLFLFYFLLHSCLISAQQPPFGSEIQAFKVQDSVQMPAQQGILFVGSSSFTYWKDVQSYFPNFPITNRGFGGSSLPDVIRYEKEVIFKYLPKQIIIYCGENDLAGDSTVSGQIVFERFQTLFNDIRMTLPKVHIVYVSMKPSPSRTHLMGKMQDGNKMIQSFLGKQKNTIFADVYHLMLDTDGQPEVSLFREDMLHMNAKGYKIWQGLLQDYLVR